MGSLRDYDEENNSFPKDEQDDVHTLSHRRQVRKMLEERLERKRLKEEFDELDGEFDWNELKP